jgi:hypothetical protein
MRGTIGAFALLAGAALVVVGLSQPLYASLWDWSPVPFGGRFVHLYRPVLTASALLVVSAALVLVGDRLPARLLGAARLVALGAAGLLSGAVWVVVLLVLVAGGPRLVVDGGAVLLLLSCLVALTGAALVREPPVPSPAWPMGAVAVSGLAAPVGSLLPLFAQRPTIHPGSLEVVVTSWTETQTWQRIPVPYGVPVAVASVLMVGSAALVLVGDRLPARLLGAARLVALGAAALLSGAVWVVVEVVSAAALAPGEFRFTLGAGVPVLVFACLIALAGAVFGQTLVREQRQGSVVLPECEENSRLSQPVERGNRGTAER